jgi:hypothetical protein
MSETGSLTADQAAEGAIELGVVSPADSLEVLAVAEFGATVNGIVSMRDGGNATADGLTREVPGKPVRGAD